MCPPCCDGVETILSSIQKVREALDDLKRYEPIGKGFTGIFPDITDCSDPKEACRKTIGIERGAEIKDVKVRF